ncbi:hypothetical protein [Intrasporangium flavum]|uniref:hypothetical protein n=1 Tax=Intrasporangium flavum TaxID=1428657 RepID=UPI00096DE3C7|nr:hypothetical protein [Intrasporangium flavum]
MASLAVAVVALAGCSASSGGAGAATPLERVRGVDASDAPSAVPFEPTASAAFRARAQQAVDRLRASGAVRAYSASLALLSPRIVETGYPDDATKTAFGSYAFRAGPDLSGAARSGTVTLVHGGTQPVDLMSAPDTLVWVLKHGIGCDGDPGGPCPVVNRADLGRVTLATSRGPASVPVWRFWADGLTTPYQVVAASEASLPDLPLTMVFDDYDYHVLGAAWARGRPGNGVEVAVEHGSCDLQIVSHVLETPDLVVVGGSSQPWTGGTCHAAGHATPSLVPLSRPLGTRPVVDVQTGRFLTETM